MRTKYKGYTVELDFTKNGDKIPTKILDTNTWYPDVAQAKEWIDANPKEGDEFNGQK